MQSHGGIVVAADRHQEWLLDWWWSHYSCHNSYPVLFVDFGMSKEGRDWCEKRGICRLLSSLGSSLRMQSDLTSARQKAWEGRYGRGIWNERIAWLKKPFALLEAPFDLVVWLDLDCQVRGSLDPLFTMLEGGADLAVAKDRVQDLEFLLPGEVHYNSGVIAFRRAAPIVRQWAEITIAWQDHLPGDQECLTRAIFLHQPSLLELPNRYNWYWVWGANEQALVHHFCGGPGKIELLRSFQTISPREQ